MSFVVLSIMLLIAIFTYQQSEKLMRNHIERELSAEIKNIEYEVTSFFEQKGEIVRQLSIIPLMKKIAEENEMLETIQTNPNYEPLQQILNDAKEMNSNVNLLWFANVERNYFVANDDQISDASFNITERPWYLNVQKQQTGISYSPPYVDHVTGKPVVSITHPVIYENQLSGYMGVDVGLEELPTILNKFEKNGLQVILTSTNDEILYDKQNMWLTLQRSNAVVGEVSRIDLDTTNEAYYTDIQQISNLGLNVAIYVPENVLLELLSKYQNSLIVFWVIALVILLTILALVLRYFLRDIPFITKQLKKMENGDFNIHIGIARKDEVGEIAYAIDQMAEKIQTQIREMDFHAHFDPLTKLPNRYLIESTLDKQFRLVGIQRQIMAVVFLDLDYFKNVNDSKGHAYGDELLIQVGRRIKNLLPDDSFFGRFGGDEFILLLFAKDGDFNTIQDILNRVHKSFEEGFMLFEHTFHITTSMGVAMYPKDAQNKEDLLANADTALYEAKKGGRNLTYFFNTEMKEAFEKTVMLQRGLRTALDQHEFILHYQPQFDIQLGKMTSVEALIRWDHPQLGMVSPADFIPLAEESGRIGEIGDWVINVSLQAIKRIREENNDIQQIAINVSAIQLREDDFVHKLEAALEKYDVPPHLLEIEITESVIIVDEEEAFRKINDLKALGINIALDDFGTGYSSLNYLHRMSIDKVKVDRSFIQQVKENPDVVSILNTIIKLGHKLGFKVVAEGVEDEQQLQLLREMHVDIIQGYYFSRPLDEASLLLYLEGLRN